MLNNELQDKIDDLEARIAFQENTIMALSDQVALQSKTIETQTLHMQLLNEKLKSIMYEMEQGQFPQSEEKPPHY